MIDLNLLNNYILNDSNMNLYLKYKENINVNKKENINVNKKENINVNKKENISVSVNVNKFFIPKEKDSLFWCFYVILNGFFNYESTRHKNTLFVKQTKINYVYLVRENKTIIKTHKFDTISNIEGNLVNDELMNIKTFITLCSIKKINILILNERTYFELLFDEINPIYIISKKHFSNTNNSNEKYGCNEKYGFEIATSEQMNDIRNNLYKINNINKPINAVSSYKLQELVEIAMKFNIITAKKRKEDLYREIQSFFIV